MGVVLLALVAAGWSRSLWTTHLTSQIRTESVANNSLEDAQSALNREFELELQYLGDPSPAVGESFDSAAGSFVRDIDAGSSQPVAATEKADMENILQSHASDVGLVERVFGDLDTGDVAATDLGSQQQGRLVELNGELSDGVSDLQKQMTQSIQTLNSDERVSFVVNAALVGLGLVLLALCWVLLLRARRLGDEISEASEQALQKARNWFRSVIEQGADLTMVISEESEITYVSPSSVGILGYEPEEIREMKGVVIHPEDETEVYTARSRCEEGGEGAIEAVEARIRHRDGTWRWFYTSFTNRLADPEFTGYVLSAHDITDRKLAESELAFSATHDSLTKLPNRTLLADRLEMSLGRSARKHTQVAVLFCDLDHFKLINDTLGHTAGDALLFAVAERLSGAVRPGDTVSRIGGDEFVVVCEGFEGVAHVRTLAERLIGSLERPFHLAGKEIFVAVSIGIRVADISTDTPDHLLRDADAAMYQAKEAGRNRAVIFDENRARQSGSRLQIESELHRALERNQLRVYYQPIISIREGTITGVEAVVRWAHPERGIVVPAEFIGAAESTGLIIPIGAWVLRQACRQLYAWKASGVERLTMSVNLSAKQLRSADMLSTVVDAIERTGVDPADLCLEVTESTLMDDPPEAKRLLDEIKGLGVRLAIDDFGTGYSSLSYLKQFPIDVLKVDRSFVSNVGTDAQDTAIVTSVIQLARALSLDTIAEGVETLEQRSQLDALGCQLAQGYLWSGPVEAAELERWIQPLRKVAQNVQRRRSSPPFTVVIADDEEQHREIVRRTLERSGKFEIAGEAVDGHGAVQRAAAEQPDLVVLDLSMPVMGGLEALPQILGASPHTRVVLLSGNAPDTPDRSMSSGAASYVRKGIRPRELLEELLLAMEGA
jgi:diguanylate cyclase (GGDEF)-like protein/PAS domain S-box-containing protein